ncbi:glycosyltransferase [Ectothiorhodospiraceae bacterium BW-2]|nr:glycosyltransferase [Ectothiorhodospiraceae bacterium BW-2]
MGSDPFYFLGNQAFRARDYAAAVQHYIQAVVDNPSLGSIVADNFKQARQRYRWLRDGCDTLSVAVCGWELSHNAAGRAYMLAQLYRCFTPVELIGCHFPHWGEQLWAPIRDTDIPHHTLVVEDEAQFVQQALQLVAAHPYDVVHFSKPRAANLLLALLYRAIWGARVLIDIDDSELAIVKASEPLSLNELMQQGAIPLLTELAGKQWTQLAVGAVDLFDGITVCNSVLQSQFGGSIIAHARDEAQFNPSIERRAQSRQRFKLAADKKVVLFFGTPRRHKGLVETAQALASLNRADTVLVVVGNFRDHGLKQELLAVNGVDIRCFSDQPFAAAPDVVAMADLCVMWQNPDSAISRYQTPAKLTDALAMGVNVVTAPLPALLDWALQPGLFLAGLDQLAAALQQALDAAGPPQRHPLFERELSFEVNRNRLQQCLKRTQPAGYSPVAAQWQALPLFYPLPLSHLQQLADSDSGITLITLTLDGAELLERLFESFFAINSYQPLEWIIVDHGRLNNPDDPTLAVVARYQQRYPQSQIRLLQRGRNYRFSESCNFAAAAARYPYLLFLNNDIIYSADALPAAFAKLGDAFIGAVGIRLDDPTESLPSGQAATVQHLGIEFVWHPERGYYQPQQIRCDHLPEQQPDSAPPLLPHQQSNLQQAVTGAFLLCRRADFAQIGGFSPVYDYGLEDIDLCLRLQRDLDKTSYCITTLSLQHQESTTRNRDLALTRERRERNHHYFKLRWDDYTQQIAEQYQQAADPDSGYRPQPSSRLNLLFVLHGPLESNSGYHIQLHAQALRQYGVHSLCAVPDHHNRSTTPPHKLRQISYTMAQRLPAAALFADGRGPDIIYAWTPREAVRRCAEALRQRHHAALVIHLEDNEPYLTEVTLGRPWSELEQCTTAELDQQIPSNRYHPRHGATFLRQAEAVTLVINTLDAFNVAQKPALVVGAPVDTQLFYPRPRNHALRQAMGIAEAHCVLVYCGNLNRANRDEINQLYQAVDQLNRNGCPTHLLRTGLDREAQARAATLDPLTAARIHHLGWVSRQQLPDILAAADILVQPGRAGAFNDQRLPSKLPEYFAMGRPVILPRSNLGLVVADGEQALVLDIADASHIATAVQRLRADPVLAERLAAGAVGFYHHQLQSDSRQLCSFLCQCLSPMR